MRRFASLEFELEAILLSNPHLRRSAYTLLTLILATSCNLFSSTPKNVTHSSTEGHGLTGQYGIRDDDSARQLIRDDQTLSFNWVRRSPLATTLKGPISVRWLGFIQPKYSETYTFYLDTSGLASLWIDGKEVIPEDQAVGQVVLKKDYKHAIAIRYDQTGSSNSISLEWQSASQRRTQVASENLYPNRPLHLQHSKGGVKPQVIGGSPGGDPGNLLYNGDFESPWGWSTGYGALKRVEPDRDGLGAAVAVPRYNSVSTSLSGGLIEQGATYSFEIWGKAPSGGSCSVRLELSDGPPLKREVLTFTSVDWEKRTVTLEHPYAAEQLYLRLGAEPTGKGDCLYDDAALRVAQNPVFPPRAAVNLLQNGDFEANVAGWTLSSSSASFIRNPGRTGTGAALDLTSGPDDPYGIVAEQTVQSSQLKPDTEYALTFWGAGDCSVMIRDPDQATGSFATSWYNFAGEDWQEKRLVLKTPPQLAKFIISLSSLGSSSCLFDDVAFGPQQADGSEESGPDEIIPAEEITAVIDSDLTPPTAYAGEEVAFSADGSVGNDLEYHWDFGDGSSVDGQDVESTAHTYDRPGYYTAQLTVHDRTTDTLKMTSLQIAVTPDIHDMPSSRAPVAGTDVTLDVQYPAAGLEYEWVWSDGSIINGPKVNKALDKQGFHDITLNIYKTDENNERVVIKSDETRVNAIAPKIDPTFYYSSVKEQFISKSDSNIVKDEWNFGNGFVEMGSSPMAPSFAPGFNPITHRVTDKFGNSYIDNMVLSTGTDDETKYYDSVIRQKENNGIFEAYRFGYAYTDALRIGNMEGLAQGIQILINGRSAGKYYNDLYGEENEECQYSILRIPNESYGGLHDGTNTVIVNADLKYNFCYGEAWYRETLTGSSGGSGSSESRTTMYQIFSSLAIPDISVNVLPDAQVEREGMTVSTVNENGVKVMKAVYLIRESSIKGNKARIKIPVYALDSAGSIMTDFHGKFEYVFTDPRIHIAYDASDPGFSNRGTYVVSGKAEVLADVEIDGNVIHINELESAGGAPSAEGCNFTVYTHSLRSQYPCGKIDITAVAPPNLSSAEPTLLDYASPQNPSPTFGPQRLLQAQSASQGIQLGTTREARARIDNFLKNFDGSAVNIALGLIPIFGDSMDLLVQSYYAASGKNVDYVVVTLATIGLAADALTGGAADITAPIKALYKCGSGSAKIIVKALVDEGRTMKPSAAFGYLKNTAGFLLDVVIKRGDMRVVGDAFQLAIEGKGAPLTALAHFTDTYATFKSQNLWSGLKDINSKIKVVKYGMFAKNAAKAVGKCGITCIRYIAEGALLKSSKLSADVNSINYFENLFIKHKQIFSENVSVWKSRTQSAIENCGLSALSSLSIRTRSIICEKLVKHIQKPNITVTPQGYISVSGGHSKSSLIEAANNAKNFKDWFGIDVKLISNGVVRVSFKPIKNGAASTGASKTAFDDVLSLKDGDHIALDDDFIKEYVDAFFDQAEKGSTETVVTMIVKSKNGKNYEIKIPSKMQVDDATKEFASVYPYRGIIFKLK